MQRFRKAFLYNEFVNGIANRPLLAVAYQGNMQSHEKKELLDSMDQACRAHACCKCVYAVGAASLRASSCGRRCYCDAATATAAAAATAAATPASLDLLPPYLPVSSLY
eukprot:6193201-Pleurochrysis_carterae.AAC.1